MYVQACTSKSSKLLCVPGPGMNQLVRGANDIARNPLQREVGEVQAFHILGAADKSELR